MKNSRLGILIVASLFTISAQAADLTLGSRVLVSENGQNFNISVFDGTASFDNTGTLTTFPPLETIALGDGTVVDYNFFHSPTETIESYAKGGAGLISDAISDAANINGAGEEWSNVWTVSDPGADLVVPTNPKDFNTVDVANTFARSAELSGTVDISSLTEGTLYFPHGTFINQWSLTVTMSGAGQPDIVVVDEDTVNGEGTNFGWITNFNFEDAAEYTSISYVYTNADRDGSRARFMGVILDGLANFGTADSDGDFLLDLWEDEFFGNNNGTIEPEDLTSTDGTGDADADGATDSQEHNAGSNPNVKDSDGDGLEDGPELNTYGSDPTLEDTDGDGLLDGAEVNTHMSDPTLVDSDGDTLGDGEEVVAGADGFVTSPILTDTDDDGVRDDIDTEPTDPANDNDGDGLSNIDERDIHGTDPLLPDTDGDGISDGEEVVAGEDGFITLPLVADTDGDGFADGVEVSLGSDPTDNSSTPSGISNLALLERIQVSTNNANFDISVFPGAAGYNDRGIGGSEPGEPTFTNPFGDGTVLDYNFFHSPDESIASYAKGEAGLIGDATSVAENIGGAGENWSNVWTATDPDGFSTPKDFSNDVVPNTFARAAEVDGTIDISNVSAGTLYIPHGTFINQWTLTLTMSGPGQEDFVAVDTQAANGVGTNFGWITSFSFSNTGGYDTISYNYTNADRDGSRARFMGVILVGAEDTSAFRITDITYTRASAPDNIIVNLTFTSKEGRNYSIYRSGDLTTPISERSDVDDGVPGAVGEDTTTFEIDFNAFSIPLVGRQFFVVVENP